ncbi:DEAD/DEAH box helicase [Clostridium perfringens]|uniref:DEAD/DEAH box helicase n=2 Tax=Clostridium perfringens TaxID=1502 RepID=UPI00297463BE|nr:DEAD/DEAH box helicase [Clostridium perfringens]MDM0639492.1 DEAD/DEAH box helicase [Clostridium perfringens]
MDNNMKFINREKSNLTKIGKIKSFNEVIKKLTIDEELTYKEKVYILNCAISFMNYFKSDKRYKSYIEFAYYIILKYSINYKDYKPLYDFCINFGFYPIAKSILKNNLIDNFSINDCILDIDMNSYNNNDYIETYEQKKIKGKLLDNKSKEISYIAPTSFGKSSIIFEHIIKNRLINKKIGIIVPTKSLLMQTYRMIKDIEINRKIIIHDDMYDGEEEFIAVVTQERALRLLEKHCVRFDMLYIDEAHNLFNKDLRNILLSRLIRKNRIKNPNQKVMYLSPLIADSNNLKFDSKQEIEEERINYNLKESEIYEYTLTGNIRKFNRFINDFCNIGNSENIYTYITTYSENKNFIYLRSPRKIEKFSRELYENLTEINTIPKINELIDELKNFVHDDFYIINLLRKGILYIHGKMPDLIKEYLEYQYKNIDEIKYIVANSVILEGINLPINTLFIMNVFSLDKKLLTNLIGRVNRLNQIFNTEKNELNKLLPKIHFVNSEEYNRKNSKMENKIKLLRSRYFSDSIENPVLEKYDIEKLNLSEEEKQKKKVEVIKIIESEEFICSEYTDEKDRIKKYLIENSIAEMYSDIDKLVDGIYMNIEKVRMRKFNWNKLNIVDKIYELFIHNIEEYITDFEFGRLKNIEARNYYYKFIYYSSRRTLKENINSLVIYFDQKSQRGEELYIGESYGEKPKVTDSYRRGKNVYVDLSQKNYKEKVNLAIVKLKIEEDFIGYKLNKFIEMIKDYKLISEEDYNKYIYGTNDKQKISLIKLGLSKSLILKLEKDKQLNNIYLDENNNLKATKEFLLYKQKLSNFIKFEIDRLF